jgi:hypothetical protein
MFLVRKSGENQLTWETFWDSTSNQATTVSCRILSNLLYANSSYFPALQDVTVTEQKFNHRNLKKLTLFVHIV